MFDIADTFHFFQFCFVMHWYFYALLTHILKGYLLSYLFTRNNRKGYWLPE